MAGWFYLGGEREGLSSRKHKGQDKESSTPINDDTSSSNHNINLQLPYRQNEEIYNKGFEIWPQYYNQHQEQQHMTDYPSSFGAGPSSRRSSLSGDLYTSRSGGGIGFGGLSVRQAGGSSSALGGGMNCQDCGNQAKKDCAHMRCRTCCKSRGFQCSTHVKSTWVPAAKRRERQQQISVSHHQQQHQHQQEDPHPHFRGEIPKRLRELGAPSSSPCTTTVRLATSSSGSEAGHFPSQVSYPAILRCVRISSLEEQDEQLAYQTAVSIGGHVFKGLLYDQGPDSRYAGSGGAGDSSPSVPQPLNLVTGTSAGSITALAVANSSFPAVSSAGVPTGALIDPSSLYSSAPLYIAGTQFFPPPRS